MQNQRPNLFPRIEKEINLIGWRRSLTISPANHIHHLLVRAKKRYLGGKQTEDISYAFWKTNTLNSPRMRTFHDTTESGRDWKKLNSFNRWKDKIFTNKFYMCQMLIADKNCSEPCWQYKQLKALRWWKLSHIQNNYSYLYRGRNYRKSCVNKVKFWRCCMYTTHIEFMFDIP